MGVISLKELYNMMVCNNMSFVCNKETGPAGNCEICIEYFHFVMLLKPFEILWVVYPGSSGEIKQKLLNICKYKGKNYTTGIKCNN
jgi:hypothetical protein